MAFDDSETTLVDVSSVVDVKIKALLAHRSQIEPDSVEFIKGWMRDSGKKKGYRYAESFKVIKLDQGSIGEEGDEATGAARNTPRGMRSTTRRAARTVPRARGRRASRSTTPARRGRPSRRGTSSG
jgi:hypothetical protein